MRTSNTTDNLLEQDARQSAPNILEHPDMRTPVVMQSQQTSSSSSSSALLIQTDCKRVSRTQSGKEINIVTEFSFDFFLSSWRLFDHASFTITRQICGILCWWSAKAETITLAWFRHCWYYRTSRTRKSKPFAIGDFLIAVDHLRMTMFKHFQRQQQRNSLVNIRNHAQTRMIIYWTWTQTILSDHFSLIYVFLSFFLLLLLFIFFPIQCVHSTMIKRRDRTTKPKNQATQRVFIYQSRDVFFLFYIQKTKKKTPKEKIQNVFKIWLVGYSWLVVKNKGLLTPRR